MMALDLEGSMALFFRALQTTGANFDYLNFLTAYDRCSFSFSFSFSYICFLLSSTKASNFYVFGIF
jgi:hypothetical protein